jgi:hypothetical protein
VDLGSRREDPDRDALVDLDGLVPEVSKEDGVFRREALAGGEQFLAGHDVATLAVDVGARFEGGPREVAVLDGRLLDFEHCVGPFGEWRTGSDPDSLAGLDSRRVVLGVHLGVGEFQGVVLCRVEREPVHGGVVRGRAVRLGDDRLGQGPARDGVYPDAFGVPFGECLRPDRQYPVDGRLPVEQVAVVVTRVVVAHIPRVGGRPNAFTASATPSLERGRCIHPGA